MSKPHPTLAGTESSAESPLAVCGLAQPSLAVGEEVPALGGDWSQTWGLSCPKHAPCFLTLPH